MNREEVLKLATEYFKGNELQANVWVDKYCLSDIPGNYLESTPEDMFHRIAKEFARIESNYSNTLSETEIYELLKDFKYVIPGGSMLYGIGNDYSVTSLGNCFTSETKIVTLGGILPIGSLVNKEPTLFSKNGKWIKSVIKSFGKQKIVELVLKRKGDRKVIRTTEDHIWFAKKNKDSKYKEYKTSELDTGYSLQYNFSKNYKSYVPSPFGVAHGFYTGDGSKYGNDRTTKRIKLCKYDSELLPYFTPYNYSVVEDGINVSGVPNYFKELPSLDENVGYLYGWLAGYFAADGCIDENGSMIISSVNLDNLNHVKHVCSVLGIGTYKISKQDRVSNLTGRDSTIYNIRLIPSLFTSGFFIKEKHRERFDDSLKLYNWIVEFVTFTEEKEEVYCAMVPETNTFTLEDNIYTHNCFVIGDTTDSYGSICKIDEEQVQLMKRRGGVGHDISHLRPAGAPINNAAVTSTGAVSFMNRYSDSTREVAQGGRRGALMLTMSVEHPDIEAFIEAKADVNKLTGCNISVKVTDDFMNKVKSEDSDACRIWDKLIHQAWATAEPGVLFWDTIVRNSPADKYEGFQSISTNPCGEIPLCPYDTCRLMSVNLFSFVNEAFTPKAWFDFDLFNTVVGKAQRLMDDAIDLENEKIGAILEKISLSNEPLDTWSREYTLWEKIQEKLLTGRRTGLSAIGLGDCLAALNVKYGSDESLKTAEEIYKTFHNAAYRSSEVMAEERGVFPAWTRTVEPEDKRRRNIALLTIPPSGSLAILAGITSGIEPVFKLDYTRRRKVDKSDNVAFVDKQGDKWEEYTVYHPKYEEYGKPESYIGCTSHDLNPFIRVEMQATVQKYIDHSISSTINLPKETTEEEIWDVYMLAWETGCKGVTIYREGCREGVLIDKKVTKFEQHDAPKRTKELVCNAHKVSIKGEQYSVVVGLYDNKPYEVFAIPYISLLKSDKQYLIVKDKSGVYYVTNSLLGLRADSFRVPLTEELNDEQKAITRLVSTALRHGTAIKFIVEQLNKIQGDLTSFNKAIARVLKTYIEDGTIIKGIKCDVCGSSMVMENGCVICKACGQSKCS